MDTTEHNLPFSDKGNLSYEATFNLHVQRTNFQLTQINMREGITVYALLPFYTAIITLHGLIIASDPSEEYKKEISSKLKLLRESLNLRKIHGMRDPEEAQMEAWFNMADVWAFQLAEMNHIGLVPPKDVDDINPTIKEKIAQVIEVPKWEPSPGDMDYRKELGIDKEPLEEIIEDEEEEVIIIPRKETIKSDIPPEKIEAFQKEIEEAREEMRILNDQKKPTTTP